MTRDGMRHPADRTLTVGLMIAFAAVLMVLTTLAYGNGLARAEWPAVCADLAIAAECIARLGEGL